MVFYMMKKNEEKLKSRLQTIWAAATVSDTASKKTSIFVSVKLNVKSLTQSFFNG